MKKKKYDVMLERTVTQILVVTVYAPDEETAGEMAVEDAEESYNDDEWSDDDTSTPVINEINEVEEDDQD